MVPLTAVLVNNPTVTSAIQLLVIAQGLAAFALNRKLVALSVEEGAE